ncbi:MAG: exodeoxyribonuclease VII small subunit [Acetatifactor sp.]|jgi:exodeoxyribonuclease VII small subunit|nr:exodeoxyribonuclease VII small subunit [Lachnospiraceae bacterium]MDE6168428.1 exodeoxyribonuclease VII small subunit [Acetatifactor sp.]MDE7354900.1 exodeoxyribonuclease VII small subunit [Acetatifactor sp.]
MDKKTEEYTLEENFARLRETIEQLEDENISLEEAFGAYSAGMAILKQCNDQIDRVEKQVLKLSEEGRLEEFENGNTGV